MSTFNFRRDDPQDLARFIVNTTPFYPNITRNVDEENEIPDLEDTTLKVVFNQGYAYDYNGSAKRYAAQNLEHEIDETKRYKFWLKVYIDIVNGGIGGNPEIIKKEGEAARGNGKDGADITGNMQSVSHSNFVEGSNTEPQDGSYQVVEMCVINQGELEELYLRENIHHWGMALQQREDTTLTATETGHAIMMTHFGRDNEVLGIRSLKEDPRSDNELTIKTVGSSIYFYSKAASGSS